MNIKNVVVLLAVLFGAGFVISTHAEVVRLKGGVHSADGDPISRAKVSVLDSNVLTDDKGEFELTAVEDVHYLLHVSHDDFYPAVHSFAAADLDCVGKCRIETINLVQRKPKRVMMTFAGDAMLGRRYLDPLPREPVLIDSDDPEPDMRAILTFVAPYLGIADFTSVNLETQLFEVVPQGGLKKSVTFFTHPKIAQILRGIGVDYVALGNNHSYDFGEAGLEKTLKILDQAQLAYSGAGADARSARLPYQVSLNDSTTSHLSYVGWPGKFKPNQVAGDNKGGAALAAPDDIAQDLGSVLTRDLNVVQIHDGLEYVSVPTLGKRTLFQSSVDFGADLVIGHHSHVIQGLDLYQGKLIAYSLGNFLFDQYIYSTQLSFLLHVWYDDADFYRAEIVPVYINGYVPTPAFGEIRFDILQRLQSLSNTNQLEFAPSGSHAIVMPRSEEASGEKISVTDMRSGEVRHLRELNVKPLDFVESIESVDQSKFRLGVDLIKRGNFEAMGDRGTTDRTWLFDGDVRLSESGHLVLQGDARTGMRTFERAFRRDNPATITFNVRAEGPATVSVFVQERPFTMSRSEALISGPMTRVIQRSVGPGISEISIDLDTPRRLAKGVRLLIAAEQGQDQRLEIDDIYWVEWTTPWIESNEDFMSTEATHLQLR